jgi:hypothetical protein
MNNTYIQYKAIYILPSLNLWEFDSVIPLGEINTILDKGNLLYFYTEDLKNDGNDYIGMVDKELFLKLLQLGIDVKNFISKIIKKTTYHQIIGLQLK